PAARARAAAEDVAAEELGEQVREARERIGPAERVAAGAERGVPEAVVLGALLVVRQDRVGLAGLLELGLGLRIFRILVGVVLVGELAVRLLQLVRRGAAADAENFVVVSLHCARQTVWPELACARLGRGCAWRFAGPGPRGLRTVAGTLNARPPRRAWPSLWSFRGEERRAKSIGLVLNELFVVGLGAGFGGDGGTAVD